MRFFTSVFPGGRMDSVERYAAEEGPQGKVKHGRFCLAGHELIAMDSHVDHGMTFNGALSLQIVCDDQAEVDRFWDVLAKGGEHGPCGWLKDRFGLSWQVVPSAVATWLAGEDSAARNRTLEALWQMRKLDIAALQRAYEGK